MNENSYYSIDRLIEFGMGMAIAQQMINTMNQAMSQMHIPGSMNQPLPIAISYYAMIDGLQTGPFSEQELSRLISEKKISKETYLWKPGMAKWDLAERIPEVLKLVALAPPPFSQE
jgi:hypothetical protein